MLRLFLRPAVLTMICLALTACNKPPQSDSNDKAPAATARESNQPSGTTVANPIGKPRPDFSLVDLQGKKHDIKEWDGKVLVINFWATWCPPCRKEMPAFVSLQEKYGARGLQFVGVAVDTPQNVTDFADTYGVNYPMLVGELKAIDIGKLYGNRFGALPYTVIIDRSGKIVFVQRGGLTKEIAEKTLLPLLG